MMESLDLLLRADTLLMTAGGLLLGIFVGALPGFSTVMAMAILLPISFFLDPMVGIPFLVGIYKGGIYGGSIPAILVGIPGTGASAASTLDGIPLMRKGQSRKALEVALAASAAGDLLSSLLTILLIGPIALIAMRIGPPELAAVLILSMLVVIASSSCGFLKGSIVLLAGVLLAMIGQDPIGAMNRFTFGFPPIEAGIELLPLLIGLFAIPEILSAIASRTSAPEVRVRPEGERLSLSELYASGRTILRSTAIGTVIGMIPGMGQVVAAFAGYAAAKRASRHPERFGTGELDGVAAPEAANNAVNSPTMVPLLTLGIPGDNVTAIMLGAFVAQGLRPGPQLFAEQGPLVYAILLSMIVACIFLAVLGYLLIPLFARIVSIPKAYLVPLTLVFAVAGTYVYRSNVMDLYFLIFFGVLGYAARRLSLDLMPLIMGFILAPQLEYAVGQSLVLAQGGFGSYIAFERPLALAILLTAPVILYLMLRPNRRQA